MISIIVATDINGGISKNKQIPWLNEEWSKADLARFKTLTTNSIIVCGRNTYNEIAALRPIKEHVLPNRRTYVVTSNIDNLCNGATTVPSLDTVIKFYPTENIFIIGGESLFNEGLQYTASIYVTQINKDYNCDQFFKFNINEYSVSTTHTTEVEYKTYLKKLERISNPL